MKFYKLQNSDFQQMFKIARIDWCSLVSGFRPTNGFLRGLRNSIKEKSPALLQKCPYSGHYEVNNATIDKTFMSIYPSGTFRVDINVTNEVGKTIATASLTLEINN